MEKFKPEKNIAPKPYEDFVNGLNTSFGKSEEFGDDKKIEVTSSHITDDVKITIDESISPIPGKMLDGDSVLEELNSNMNESIADATHAALNNLENNESILVKNEDYETAQKVNDQINRLL